MQAHPLKKNNVTIEGNQDAEKTLIFAHGFGTDQTSWYRVKDAFKHNYRIVLYDNVGSGKADINAYSPIRYSTLNSYADDLIDIAKTLDLRNTTVVAHSASSMICALAGIKAPEYFSKQVFIGASPRYLNDNPYKGGFEQADMEAVFEAMSTNYYAWVSGFSGIMMGNSERPELREEFAGTLSSLRPDIAFSVLKLILQSDLRDVLPEIQKETLIVQSYDDAAVPLEVGEYLNKNIRNSRLVKIKATGHFPQISAPEEVIKSINSFILN